MSEIARLRRTVRRCTAVLVAAIGIHLGGVPGYESNWPAVMVALSLFYLAVSALDQSGRLKESRNDERDDRGSQSPNAERGD
jgi:hypothetical protein